MRPLVFVLGTLGSTVAGAFTLMEVSEGVLIVIDRYAPGYYAGRYSWAVQYSQRGFDAPRKFAWGNLLLEAGAWGGLVNCVVTGLILFLRLGNIASAIRSFLYVLASSIAGAGIGGGIGYGLGRVAPDYYRGALRAGGEPWFDPVQVGLGLGISQGLLVGIVIGGAVVLVVTWYRSNAHAFPALRLTELGIGPEPTGDGTVSANRSSPLPRRC